MRDLEKIEEDSEEVCDLSNDDEPLQKPVKPKRQQTEKQKEAFKKCLAKREEKRNERKQMLEQYNKAKEEEIEKKVMKKADEIKKKVIKRKTKEILESEITQEEDDEPVEPVKKEKTNKKLHLGECQDEYNFLAKPSRPYQDKTYTNHSVPDVKEKFVWC
jgi:hypothetical protein